MSHSEVEFKFCLNAAQASALEAAMRRGAVERERLQARYFDTAESTLAKLRIAMRLRKEGARWVQTVKAAGAHSLERLEHNVSLPASRARPEPDPALHADTEVGVLLQQALASTALPLVPIYETDVWRLTRLVRVPGGWVELALDNGQIRAVRLQDGKRVSQPLHELELELVRGDVAALTTLAQRWVGKHKLWLSTVSKAEQGERLRAGIKYGVAVKASPSRFTGGKPKGRAILQAAVAACMAQVLPNASEVAAGSNDAEHIHQLRIGLRRLRTALRELAPLAPGTVQPQWLAPLVEVFRGLGELRDREQLLQDMQAQLLAAGGPPLDFGETPLGRSATEIVRAAAFQSVLTALTGFVAEPAELGEQAARRSLRPPAGDAAWAADASLAAAAMVVDGNGLAHQQALAHLRQRFDKLHAQALRADKRFASLGDDQRHSARKRLKRLRYLTEFSADLFAPRDAARYLARLRRAQNASGAYNDEVVALQAWRALADADARAWFGVGWWLARQPELVGHSAKQLQRLSQAPRFWRA